MHRIVVFSGYSLSLTPGAVCVPKMMMALTVCTDVHKPDYVAQCLGSERGAKGRQLCSESMGDACSCMSNYYACRKVY